MQASKQIKVMQIASHKTNIGDGANITGFQKIFTEDAATAGFDVSFHDEEIMEYKPHLGEKDFNSDTFINLANSMDLVVIGGGGFFSAFERFKNTGCHVDFTLETLKKIKTPVVYYALGFAVYYGQAYYNTEKLDLLLRYAQEHNDKILVSLRNDGSFNRLKELSRVDLNGLVSVIPDGGFYVPVIDTPHPELEENRLNFGIQLAGDKAPMRFRDKVSFPFRVVRKLLGGRYTIENVNHQTQALKAIARVAEWLVNEHNGNLVLIPHIHSDLAITDRFTHLLPRDLVRFNTQIAGVYRGHEGGRKQFDLYKKLAFSIGMRFHSNVCPFGLETPSIGLVSHDQLDGLYGELGSDDFVYLNDPDLETKLKEKVAYILQNESSIRSVRHDKNKELRDTSHRFHSRMLALLR